MSIKYGNSWPDGHDAQSALEAADLGVSERARAAARHLRASLSPDRTLLYDLLAGACSAVASSSPLPDSLSKVLLDASGTAFQIGQQERRERDARKGTTDGKDSRPAES